MHDKRNYRAAAPAAKVANGWSANLRRGSVCQPFPYQPVVKARFQGVTCRQQMCCDQGSRPPELLRQVWRVGRISPVIGRATQQQNGVAPQRRKAGFSIG